MEEARREQTDLANSLLGLDIGNDQLPSTTKQSSDAVNAAVDLNLRRIGPNCEHHELHLEFPALHLLPDDTQPYLTTPRDARYRQPPNSNVFRRDNPYPLCYVTRIETVGKIATSAIPEDLVYGSCAGALVDSIDSLAFAPGISKLELVTWKKSGTVTYCALLTTTWINEDHEATRSKRFQFGDNRWTATFENRNEEDWPVLLCDLLERASDRAFFHVRERLNAHSIELAQAEDAHCEEKWDTVKLKTAKQLVLSCLVWLSSNDEDKSHAVFPCGHLCMIDASHYSHISEVEAAELQCSDCSKYVLTDTQFRQIEAWWDHCRRAKNFLDEQCWAGLERNILEPNSTFEITHEELRVAINEVLATLETPESIDPLQLCPTNFHETAIVALHFLKILRNDSGTLSVSLDVAPRTFTENARAKLREHYGLESKDDLDAVLPVGYPEFLWRWMQRVFVLLAIRIQEGGNELVENLTEILIDGISVGNRGDDRKQKRA